MHAQSTLKLRAIANHPYAADEAAIAYDGAGAGYLAYADGEADRLFAFEGRNAYADRRVWAVIEMRLKALAGAGERRLTVLDAGCGPGTWLRRIVTRALELGFTRIEARGFDVSHEMLEIARRESRMLAAQECVDLRFQSADIARPLPEAAASVDICLCLYVVLNHLEQELLPTVARELARVTRGYLLATVRAVEGSPSIYVGDIADAADFRQDHGQDRLDIDLRDGRHISFHSHLFRAAELERLFAPFIGVVSLVGLDLFHSRFAADPRWNPAGVDLAPFHAEIERLERAHGCNPQFIDHATHILLVAEVSAGSER